MTSIDDIIAQSRRTSGGFAKRSTFTLARERAIHKLREFALADPHYFILELIQSAVANGATSIAIECNDENFLFSYVGGSVSHEELAHLFDFLFASKDRLEVGHLRELALGINALLLFEPEQLVLESGSGAAGQTHRMVIERGGRVDVGRADASLDGTYIVARGLDRKRIANRSTLGPHPLGPPELSAAEERCLAAPVPILANYEPLFGYSALRIPVLWGHDPVRAFDEGDLYGAIGVDRFAGTGRFRLLTRGVWIQSVERQLIENVDLGGIVSFDRLRKTADHSAIVLDDVFEEMWVRLRPHALKLVGRGDRASLHAVTLLSGVNIEPRELRGWLRQQGRILLAEPGDVPDALLEHTARLADGMGATVVRSPRRELVSLKRLGGDDVEVIALRPTQKMDWELLAAPASAPPPEPYLAAPIEVPSMSVEEAAAELERLWDVDNARAVQHLGHIGRIRALLYAPEDPAPARMGVWVQVRVADRVVWQGELPSATRGHWLVITVPAVAPSDLLQFMVPTTDPTMFARGIARVILRRAEPQQSALAQRALSALLRAGIGASDTARRRGLETAAQTSFLRLRSGNGRPSVSIASRDDGAILETPLLRTVGGGVVSLRDLAATMVESHGLIYGRVAQVEADLDGLDTLRILELDLESEHTLVNLFGESAYVRVDRRDVLAEHDGVQVRDIALSLRDYPDFPLLVEGIDPSGWSAERKTALLERLVDQLIERFLGRFPRQPTHPAEFPDWEENRRQTCRHLQWFAIHCLSHPKTPSYRVIDLPLFANRRGQVFSASQVAKALKSEDGLILHYGGSLGSEQLGILSRAAAQGARGGASAPRELAASPFVHRLLAPLGRVRLDFDFELDRPEGGARQEQRPHAFVLDEPVAGNGFAGHLGFSRASVADPAVVILDSRGRRLGALRELARNYGVVGYLCLEAGQGEEGLRDRVHAAIETSLERLMSELSVSLPQLEGALADRATAALLAYAGHHLSLEASPRGVVTANAVRPAAQRILDLPLFPVGNRRVSGWRLVNEFCSWGVAAFETNRKTALAAIMTESPGEPFRWWIHQYLDETRVTRLATSAARSTKATPPSSEANSEGERLARALAWWLEQLRPDQHRASPNGDPRTTVDLVPSSWLEGAKGLGQYRDRGAARRDYFLLNAEHDLVERALANPEDPERFAWLLLGIYAVINAVLEPVTNRHEEQFQRAVLAALDTGELGWSG